jgi:TRAP-type C4-dicarboxylate transport system permease small subunit
MSDAIREGAAGPVRALVLHALWRGLERVAEGVIVLLVLGMVVACLAQVVWRYALGDPLTWSEEAARYLLVWTSFLCAWLAWRARSHLGLDILVAQAPASLRRWLDRAVEAAVAGFCLLSIWAGQRMVEVGLMQPSAVLEIPMGYVYAAWPVAAALILGDVLVGWITGRRVQAQGGDWI